MLQQNTIYNIDIENNNLTNNNKIVKEFDDIKDLMSFVRKHYYKPVTKTSFEVLIPKELPNQDYIGLEYYARPSKKFKIVDYVYINGGLYYDADEIDLITNEIKKAKEFGSVLLETKEIKRNLENQEQIIKDIESNMIFLKKQEELELQQKEKERKEKEEYEFCYGFCDNKTPLQKGKVLKILNKKYRYSDYGVLSRKDFILKTLQDNGFPSLEHNVNKWTRNGVKKIENYYSIKYERKNYYQEITKTEYDYAHHLVKQKVI